MVRLVMQARSCYGRSRFYIPIAAALITGALGCGGGGTEPNPPGTTPAAIAITAGNNQTFRVNAAVPVRPAVRVTASNGSPVPGIAVTFAVVSGGGSLTAHTATTDAQGITTVGSWTLGSVGPQKLTATVQGAPLSVEINATARYPRWTIAVYMAADNNLAYDGLNDIDEIESAVQDPEIQVVVQAEFDPATLAQYGCASSTCFNRPNFNTFRYVVGEAPARRGPDVSATDLGNRNMVDPIQLTEFIQWARQAAPSERLVLIPWNHGGGYTGLLADETSSPGTEMSMAGFRAALQAAGGPPIDVVDFDMCLMGAYETLVSLQGLARYAVFSQEVTPAAGNDYTRLLNAVRGVNLEDGSAVAGAIADAFYAGFEGERSSTTISAYDLTALGAFDQALSSLASHLKADVSTFGPLVAQAGSGVLRFHSRELADVLNFADSLEARVADATIRADIAALRSAATAASFRLRNRFRNGLIPGFAETGDVTRASGLHLLLPDVTSEPTMGDVGPRSLGSYLAIYGTTGWGQFLAAYLGTPAVADVTDLGTNRLETYLLWSSDAQTAGVDIDLWILEPDGTIASPYFGSVSPNGTLTNDSFQSGYPVEGYLTNRFVMDGTYIWYAFLIDDPQTVQPLVDFVYRYGNDPFVSIYGAGPYPQLSRAQSILADADPTFGEADAGAYSDFIPLANATFGPAPIVAAAPGTSRHAAKSLPRLVVGSRGAPIATNVRGMPGVRPTQRQIATMRTLLEQRRAGVRPAQVRGLARLRPTSRLMAEFAR